MELVEALRDQAGACGRLGSPMYADLLGRAADDVVAGGPAAEVLAGHEEDPGPSALALRLLGSVHRLVLERRAGALAASYPSVGGTWSPEPGWAGFRALLAEQPDAVAEWLDRAPQTNEVGRSSALMAGLLVLVREQTLPVRLFEMGSSAGLNLLAETFRYVSDTGVSLGPRDSPVVLDPAWRGPGPWSEDAAWPRVVERVGSDVLPIDARTTEGRLALTAYVWPDQVHRHERLRGALALAQRVPHEVRRQSADDLVASLSLKAGAVTVLWHSVMWQYVAPDEQQRVRASIDALAARATTSAPFAHLFHEPVRRTTGSDFEFWLVLQSWPGGERRFLARVHSHGAPTTWDAARPYGPTASDWMATW